ncbi:MAG: hypothetical protein HDT18_07685 [Oscillibacter sp.]|nr:hypothetical protein [Oscillibacter sp.]
MKRVKYIFAVLLACWMFVGGLCIPAMAADYSEEMQTIVYFEDGSYLVTTIVSDPQTVMSERGTVNTKGGTKHQDYYNSSRELMWTFRVHGTFTYDGYRAEATYADYSYDVYNSAWSFNSATASYSGATATANGSFSRYTLPNSVSLSLTCSPKGVLS